MTNTTDTLGNKILLLGLDSSDSSGQIELFRSDNLFATDYKQRITLIPYGTSFNQGIDVATAQDDKKNVTNLITIQSSLKNPASDKFAVKLFDGNKLIEKQAPKNTLNGDENNLLIKEFTPFLNISPSSKQIASVASGDIDGDGFSDIVVGLGGGVDPVIEVYSGKDYRLLSRINPFNQEQDFKDKINLAVGDINGDGFEDIIVGQGSTGRGLVEVYSGLLIKNTGTINGIDTAHTTTLLSDEFQPYGSEYIGEVDVTSGYILQRPDKPNGFPVQTNKANLITLAKNDIIDSSDQIQVFTFREESVNQEQEKDNCSCSHNYKDFSLDASLTPNISFIPSADPQAISGTFADLPGLSNSPVLFTRKKDGEYEIIKLGDENEPELIPVVLATNTASGNGTEITKENNKDIFTLKGGSNGKIKLKVTLEEYSSSFVNEMGVFSVDDDNCNIGGIAPGTSGYTEAALARSKVVFSSIANLPTGFNNTGISSLLEFNSGERVRFLLVNNSTLNAVSSGVTSKTEVLFSETSQQIDTLTGGEFSLKWQDKSANSNLKVKIKATSESSLQGTSLQGNLAGEILDFRSATTDVKAEFKVYREAAFNNFVGFYPILDATGKIDTNKDGKADFAPGDAGYLQAAINSYLKDMRLSVSNQGEATYQGTFAKGSLFAPFIIADGTPEAVLGNSGNIPAVYFPFLGANSDRADHIRLLGNNVFGFEDLPNGSSDRDYNDIIVKITVV